MRIITSNKIIKLKFNDIEFTIKPLTQAQKLEVIEELAKHPVGTDAYLKTVVKSGMLILKKTLKSLTNVYDQDGDPWELKFDENGEVSDDSLAELATAEESSVLLTASMAFFQKYPKDGVIIDPQTQLPIEGLSILLPENAKKKKSRHG